MATPKTLIILLLLLGVISACPDGECRQLFFRADFTFGNRRLIKHVIESVSVRDFDNCELSCYQQPNCVSINFNVIRDSGGFHKCELNNATHRGHDNDQRWLHIQRRRVLVIKGPAKIEEPANLDTQTKAIVVFALHNGHQIIANKTSTNVKMDKPTSVTRMQFAVTPKDHTVAIANEDSLVMDSLAPVRKQTKDDDDNDGDNDDVDAIIPHPSAWFPFNGTYNTSEIDNRTTSGSKYGEVYLSLGPDGTQNGSYFFRGSPAGSINFTGINSKLDIGVSITILFWLYTYDNEPETTFLQYKGMKLVVNHEQLTLTFSEPATSNGLTGILAEKGWKFVGVSYNKTTAEAKLWIDGKIVKSDKPTVNFDSQLLTLGGDNFKGKITQLMLFNLSLTEEQIQGIKGKMRLPAMIFNSTIISNNSFYKAELASFLAPVVGQMESKWKLCYSALAYANKKHPKTFHDNCDNKNHTVTIIKRATYIFGGYTDIPWEATSSKTWGETMKAFIFSLKTSSKALPPFKCLAISKYKAIYKSSRFGPSFGENPCLYISSSKTSVARIGYPYSVPIEVDRKAQGVPVKVNEEVLAGADLFFVPDNYEVFYLA
ncbi:hypothetical protein P5673_033195 [Acropora cervicornis]|uniref:TLDc domain-containing protein n=1 Tax=Acropora cervicornis TaxID=6130 RepID=A0AAD9URB1_ACRCE|nr:hypothetical protein P5673_033195 [Acropora cervicornis]